MAVIKGVKEKVHLPLYDSIEVKPKTAFGTLQSSNVIRFFQDVTGKTKLRTNMQASSLLPHWNTFEARAMRVVISDLAPQFPEKPAANLEGLAVVGPTGAAQRGGADLIVDLRNLTLVNFVDLSRRLESLSPGTLRLSAGDVLALSTVNNPVRVFDSTGKVELDPPLASGELVEIDRGHLEALRQSLADAGVVIPPREQIFPNNGAGHVISRFIYNTVTSFYVGEKVMIQVPTWFFPAGAGPFSEDGKVTTHGYPSPEATFRFAEPIFVDTQQNFRVEIEIPESDVLADLQRLYGPFFVWVVIDGYMTRDVQ